VLGALEKKNELLPQNSWGGAGPRSPPRCEAPGCFCSQLPAEIWGGGWLGIELGFGAGALRPPLPSSSPGPCGWESGTVGFWGWGFGGALNHVGVIECKSRGWGRMWDGFGAGSWVQGAEQAVLGWLRAGAKPGWVKPGWGGKGGLRPSLGGPLKPARHPHEGAQGRAGGGPRQQPQGHLVPGDPVGILAHDDVGHPGSCKAKSGVSWGGGGRCRPPGTPLWILRGATGLGWRGTPPVLAVAAASSPPPWTLPRREPSVASPNYETIAPGAEGETVTPRPRPNPDLGEGWGGDGAAATHLRTGGRSGRSWCRRSGGSRGAPSGSSRRRRGRRRVPGSGGSAAWGWWPARGRKPNRGGRVGGWNHLGSSAVRERGAQGGRRARGSLCWRTQIASLCLGHLSHVPITVTVSPLP